MEHALDLMKRMGFKRIALRLLVSAVLVLPGWVVAQEALDPQDEPTVEEGVEDLPVHDADPARPSGPDPARFDFLRTEPMAPDPDHDHAVARLTEEILSLTPDELDRVIEEAARAARPEDDLSKLHTIDGGIYHERESVLELYPSTPEDTDRTSKPPADERNGLNPWFRTERDHAHSWPGTEAAEARLYLAKVFGSDGRTPITSAAYAWRAVGVKLHGGNGIETCSGAMIAPRLVLTAAHCFTSNGNNVTKPLYVSPASRGASYSGNHYPFGQRQGIWYWWPSGWGGKTTDIRYDYGVILLTDINWSPGYVSFGHRSVASLDYRKYNTAGYPSRSFDCRNSPLGENQSCDGYMYRQYEEVRAVADGRMYNKFDFQKGQSGSPIYDLDGNSRVIVGILNYSYHVSNIATRIRSGVFDFLCKRLENPDNHSSFFGNPGC